MEIKKCCNKSHMIFLTDYIEDKRQKNKKPTIWHIPPGRYEECGFSVVIKYCPFCGKKIEMKK